MRGDGAVSDYFIAAKTMEGLKGFLEGGMLTETGDRYKE